MNRVSVLIACGSAALTLAASAQPYYRLTDLGALTSPGESMAYAVNASGQAAGYSLYEVPTRFTSGTLAQAGGVQGLGHLPGGRWSWAYGINDAGLAVGVSHKPTFFAGSFFAFKTDGAVMTQLTELVAGGANGAAGINAAGVIVGYSVPSAALLGTINAVRWTGSQVTNLGTLGGFNSYACAINIHGDIAGASELASGPLHACLWRGAAKTDLGTLGGRASEARDINDAAQVVGWAHLPDGTRRAFLWQNGVMADLGTLGTSSEARAINAHGWVVGTSWVIGRGQRAFVRAPLASPINLNHRLLGADGWIMQHATDINGSGTIVGYGRRNGATRAFLLTPGLCAADINADGAVDGIDYDLFNNAFENPDPDRQVYADFNNDGFVDGIDSDQFHNAFDAGC